jgi:hypothetical protein
MIKRLTAFAAIVVIVGLTPAVAAADSPTTPTPVKTLTISGVASAGSTPGTVNVTWTFGNPTPATAFVYSFSPGSIAPVVVNSTKIPVPGGQVIQSGVPCGKQGDNAFIDGYITPPTDTIGAINTATCPTPPIPPPTPVAPTVTLSAAPSTACGIYTVPVTLKTGAGSNLPAGQSGMATFATNPAQTFTPNPVTITPSGTFTSSTTFPASDAGKAETLSAVYSWMGFPGTMTVSVMVTLPMACPPPTTVPPATVPPTKPPTPTTPTPPPGVIGTAAPTPAPVVPPRVNTPTPTSPALANTGAAIGTTTGIGAAALGLGALLVLLARRRRANA